MEDSAISSEKGKSPFDLSAAIGIVLKRKWMILGITLAVPVVVGFFISKQPRVYETTASLVIDPSVPQYLGQSFKDVVELESNWWSAQEALQTELRVLRSHSQSAAVAKALCDRPVGAAKTVALDLIAPAPATFSKALPRRCDDPERLDAAAPVLQTMVRAEPIKDSRLVNLVVDADNPEIAALVANTAAQVYAERNLERRLSDSTGAASWLGDQYGDLTTQLNDSERQLIEFKRQNNVVAVAIEDQQNDLSSRHKKLAEELNTVQVKLIALRAQRDQYALLKTDDPMNEIMPGVVDSPVVLKLKELYIEQYAKLLELRGKYLDKHPAVIAQEARVTAIKSDLAREASLASRSVAAQYATGLKQEHELKTALDSATHEALQLEQRAIEYNRLKRNFDRLQKLSEQVGGRERETSLAGHLKTNNVHILDAAIAPTFAISPNVPRAVVLAFGMGLLLALALSFLLEMLDTTVKTQDDIEHGLGLAFLGLIPSIQSDAVDPRGSVAMNPLLADSKDLYVMQHPKSAVAECCRSIRTNLLFMSPDRPARSLLVTSAGPQEGKSMTAINLGISMVQSGLRVLLADTDMRRPRLHKAFGLPALSEGLSKAIVGETDVLSMVRETGVPGLFLLPCGATPPNPAELFHAERFKRIVAELTEHFDRVIFDSPPVCAVTDAAILSRLTDGTILVANCSRTSKETLGRARRQLTEGGVNILGCILNNIDLTKQGPYGYYDYSRYGYYYHEDDLAPAKPTTGT